MVCAGTVRRISPRVTVIVTISISRNVVDTEAAKNAVAAATVEATTGVTSVLNLAKNLVSGSWRITDHDPVSRKEKADLLVRELQESSDVKRKRGRFKPDQSKCG